MNYAMYKTNVIIMIVVANKYLFKLNFDINFYFMMVTVN